MTVKQRETIDFVVHDPGRDEALLILVQDEAWGESGRQLPALEAKLNTYFAYVTEGRLVIDHPTFAGKGIHVQLRATTPPGGRELEFLSIVAVHHLQPARIRLSWKVIGEDDVHDV